MRGWIREMNVEIDRANLERVLIYRYLSVKVEAGEGSEEEAIQKVIEENKVLGPVNSMLKSKITNIGWRIQYIALGSRIVAPWEVGIGGSRETRK